jgi:hypothetical protein
MSRYDAGVDGALRVGLRPGQDDRRLDVVDVVDDLT